MTAALRKGEWVLSYDDGSDKVAVSFDAGCEGSFATRINVQYSIDFQIYVEAADAAWLAARLLDAAEAIAKARGEQ